ncbi:MAG TPA: carbon-nitrogen hydrolase family protein [Pirellulaceae bacterium]|nr:carbon-nitrogen hydrolase family protein [Pirellulaceae bacterium]HMO92170.1 carbon-nitrogen hydrolase family protein [Pirellulaceae bacterium]
MFRIASVQTDIQFGNIDENLKRTLEKMTEASANGARLVVFPECSLTGYCCETKEEGKAIGLNLQSTVFRRLHESCRSLNVFGVFGFLETEDESDDLFNSLVCIGPAGIVAHYRKTHLPQLGVDRFVTCGQAAYDVFEIDKVQVGMLICYDSSFPEATRVLALKGADVVLLPTNWPAASISIAELVPPVRAMENHIYFVVANRVGLERGVSFVGRSRIIHPNGSSLTYAEHDREEVLIADIDPELARQKRIVRVLGKHEVNLIADRRPELYGEIIEKSVQH